jgi:hypothetical protein
LQSVLSLPPNTKIPSPKAQIHSQKGLILSPKSKIISQTLSSSHQPLNPGKPKVKIMRRKRGRTLLQKWEARERRTERGLVQVFGHSDSSVGVRGMLEIHFRLLEMKGKRWRWADMPGSIDYSNSDRITWELIVKVRV